LHTKGEIMTVQEFRRGTGAERAGRTAKTKGVSLSPDQLADINAFEELTGLGLSEIFRRQLAPKLHAAVSLLESAKDSGMELDRSRLRTEWVVGMSREELKTLYSSPSELVLGD
jgi:hypothetical protein